MSSNRCKRPLEPDDGSDEENVNPPRIRIKTEVDLMEKNGWESEDSNGPPTPPVPRTNDEDDYQTGGMDVEVDNGPSFPAVIIKQEPGVDPEPVPCTSSQAVAADIRGQERRTVREAPSEVIVKSEPNEFSPSRVKTSPPPDNKSSQGDTEEPKISNFYSFSSKPVVDATLPKVMTSTSSDASSDTRPKKAPYYAIRPDQEQNYGENRSGTIPMYSKKSSKGSGDEDSDEASDNENDNYAVGTNGMPSQTRYFARREVYKRYNFEPRNENATKLAVHEKKAHILNSLESSRVLIIEGFTGCGKTTQVPQYILDKCRENQSTCNIVVTQPRKIAAISVARRVCEEREWNLGTVVGYQVSRDEKRDRNDTLLTYVTTGVLLQQLITQKSLKNFTHIIIDEVHERDLESDFLLLVIKKIMAADTEGKEQHVKLILMSATIDTKKFENYFLFETPDGDIVRPHVVKIPFVPRYKIEEKYLDDVLRGETDLLTQIESNLDKEKATIQEEIYDVTVRVITDLDLLEKSSYPDPRMRKKDGLMKERGAVLVFLPGMEEIKRLHRALDAAENENNKANQKSYSWSIIPLHSSVTAEDQAKVFEKSKNAVRKIILSTNIAESSVTVPDIAYVIDFCLTKSLCIDQTTNFTTLRMVWAAKSQCIQRRGRTGRVSNGKVYRMLPKRFYNDNLEEQIVPEMKRSNLETVILMCKKFELDSPLNLLSQALDKPDLSGIQRATATLKELGALTIEMRDPRTRNGTFYDVCNGDLTFVGEIMASLPIPQQCTRLILLGHCFGVMQEAIIIAAGVSVKNPFQTGFKKQLDTYLKKMEHAQKSFSDLFALYHVYKFWDLNYAEAGRKKFLAERRWASGAEVHIPVLREIKSTVVQLEERLKKLGITNNYSLPGITNNPNELTAEQGIFLKLAIAGAFYPRYFLRRRPDLKLYEKEVQKVTNGHDPFRTVYFKGFPNHNEGRLYAKYVADYLSYGLNAPAIRFDGQKVFAIFDNSTGDTIGPFNRGLFRAIKLRQLRTETLEFNVLWKEQEERALRAWDERVRRRRCNPCPPLRHLPPVNVQCVTVKVQHVVSPSQFWVVVKQDFGKLEWMFNLIQQHAAPIFLPDSKLFPNALCLAPFDSCYYRAKIIRIRQLNPHSAKQALVYFIDYGNSEWVSASVLYDFSPKLIQEGVHAIPCMAIECRLQELKPNTAHGLHWSNESIAFMRKFHTKAPNLDFEIYSIYDSIMVGELVGYDDKNPRTSLNTLLTSRNEDSNKLFGEYAPEPYFSMENHRLRERASYMNESERRGANEEQYGEPLDLDFIDPPREAKTPCLLKGPWSPLEMTFQALVQCSNTKEVRVENSSVNSVSLDHEPTASNSRMLVAAHVGVVERSQSVMVRESTIMPPIAGILSLLCLMFAPKAELRIDRDQSKYTGVLCGCGTVPNSNDRDNMPVHTDNDMEIVFDTVIDDSDIDQVNMIRNHMSYILRSRGGVNKAEVHKKLRVEMLKLLKKKRDKIDEEVWPQEEYVWNRIDEDFLQPVMTGGLSFHHDDIFQPHRKVILNQMVEENVEWDLGY